MSNSILKTFFIFVLICFLQTIFLSNTSDAVFLPEGINEDFYIEINPETPAPKENVKINIAGYISNFNFADITWTVNGKVVLNGVGKTSYSFQNADIGEKKIVNIFIQKDDGSSLERTFIFQPALVDLNYQALTYTPPFYKGKALFTEESSVLVVAKPFFIESNGQKLSEDSLVYEWKKDGVLIQDASGYGKKSAIIPGSPISKTSRISVSVTAPNSDLSADKNIFITPTTPKVLVYEKDPLNGIIFDRAINQNYEMKGQELSLWAVPYFFSFTKTKDSYAKYSWKINNSPISQPDFLNEIFISNNGQDSGKSQISVRLNNINTLLQDATANLNIRFGTKEQ